MPISLSDRFWYVNPGASSQAIQKLVACVGSELPNEYFDLLRYSNGGEGPLPLSPYNFCLDSAEDAAQSKIAKMHKEFFPGFFVFGTNGGGEYIAFDLRGSSPWPIVAIDMTNIDLAESVQFIAPDFPSFLEFVGLEAYET